MSNPEPYSRVAHGSEFIGAGDDVCVISCDGRSFDVLEGVLVDVNGDDAIVNVAGDWQTYPFDRVAHCDSDQAQAVASFGDVG